MDEIKEAIRYYIKHPWTFLAELIGLFGLFFAGSLFLSFGHALGLN